MTLAQAERVFRTLLPITKSLEDRISCLPEDSEESEELCGAVDEITEGLMDVSGVPADETVEIDDKGKPHMRPEGFCRDYGYDIFGKYRSGEISLNICFAQFKQYLYELNKYHVASSSK